MGNTLKLLLMMLAVTHTVVSVNGNHMLLHLSPKGYMTHYSYLALYWFNILNIAMDTTAFILPHTLTWFEMFWQLLEECHYKFMTSLLHPHLQMMRIALRKIQHILVHLLRALAITTSATLEVRTTVRRNVKIMLAARFGLGTVPILKGTKTPVGLKLGKWQLDQIKRQLAKFQDPKDAVILWLDLNFPIP